MTAAKNTLRAPAKKAVPRKALQTPKAAPASAVVPAPVPKAKPAASPKPAAKTAPDVKAAKPTKPVKPVKPVKPTKPPKQRSKPVRDGFTMPPADFALIAALKARTLAAGRETKKSELLRAGIQALEAMSDRAFLKAIGAVPTLKTERPKAS